MCSDYYLITVSQARRARDHSQFFSAARVKFRVALSLTSSIIAFSSGRTARMSLRTLAT